MHIMNILCASASLREPGFLSSRRSEKSVRGDLGKEVKDEGARNDKADAEHGWEVELLLVEQPSDNGDKRRAYS